MEARARFGSFLVLVLLSFQETLATDLSRKHSQQSLQVLVESAAPADIRSASGDTTDDDAMTSGLGFRHMLGLEVHETKPDLHQNVQRVEVLSHNGNAAAAGLNHIFFQVNSHTQTNRSQEEQDSETRNGDQEGRQVIPAAKESGKVSEQLPRLQLPRWQGVPPASLVEMEPVDAGDDASLDDSAQLLRDKPQSMMRREMPRSPDDPRLGDESNSLMQTVATLGSSIFLTAFGQSSDDVQRAYAAESSLETESSPTSSWIWVVLLLLLAILLFICSRALEGMWHRIRGQDEHAPAITDGAEMSSQPKLRSSCTGEVQTLLADAIKVALPSSAKQSRAPEILAPLPTPKSEIRRNIESLPVFSADEADKWLQTPLGYDCALSRPLSSRKLLRFQARVVLPPGSPALTSPLTQQACVLYSVSASRLQHEGMHPAPVAHSSASINFIASILGPCDMHMEVTGSDVALFDMRRGRLAESCHFGAAASHWQEFVTAHELSTNSRCRGLEGNLEFQECALLVGSEVTVVGEFIRTSDGSLMLQPFEGPTEAWRTSWEMAGSQEQCQVVSSNVLISDNPELLTGTLGGSKSQICL